MTDMDPYVKRLETIQGMSEDAGVKQLCEVLMDYLENASKDKNLGFVGDDK